MLKVPMDILKLHPIRKTEEQKEAFRRDVQAYVQELGYSYTLETEKNKANNVIIGYAEQAKYLISAHYDTPATLGIPNVCTPCNALLAGLRYLAAVLFGASCSGGAFLLIKAGFLIPGIALIILLLCDLWLMKIAPANVNNANDNTSGVVTLLEIARSLPEAHRHKVCFLLFDLEEKGLKGSAAYRKAHKDITEKQILLNLDCVGDGDHILLMPTKKLRKDAAFISRLKYLGGWFGKKQILTIDKGFCAYSSDHKNFPLAVGIAAFHKRKGMGFVLDKIHTKHDTNLEITNVNLLRAAMITLIGSDAVN
jgi:hypothetical protein